MATSELQTLSPGNHDVEPAPTDDTTRPVPTLLHNRRADFVPVCHAPTYYHGLLSLLVNESPQLEEPVPIELLPPTRPGAELARRAIIDYLNNPFEPALTVKESRTFTSPTEGNESRRPYTCFMAEDYFTGTLDSMQNTVGLDRSDNPNNNEGWIIVVDDTSEPIAIKKRAGQPSALSLTEVAIDGHSFPAGSLLEINLREDTSPKDHLSKVVSKNVTPYYNITSARFLRLSAFAHSPEERQDVFKHMDFTSNSAQMNLDEIVDLARRCIPGSMPVGFEESLLQKLRPRRLGGWLMERLSL